METTGINYNPHQMIELRKIVNGESTFAYYKATELEGILNNSTLLEQRIAHNEKQLGQIIDNLTIEGWYSDSIEKSEVLRDLCTIVDHTPQQEMSWTVTMTVSGTTMVNLEDVEDFDIRYELSDNLSVDSNDFNTSVDSWDIDLIDSQDWN